MREPKLTELLPILVVSRLWGSETSRSRLRPASVLAGPEARVPADARGQRV